MKKVKELLETLTDFIASFTVLLVVLSLVVVIIKLFV